MAIVQVVVKMKANFWKVPSWAPYRKAELPMVVIAPLKMLMPISPNDSVVRGNLVIAALWT